MNSDKYYYLPKAHERPNDYTVPPTNELTSDTQHPELNSRNYRHLIYSNDEEPKDFLPVYSLLGSKNGLFVVGTNNFTSCTFDGNFIGTKHFDSIVQHDLEKTRFVIPARSTATGFKFIDNDKVNKTIAFFIPLNLIA